MIHIKRLLSAYCAADSQWPVNLVNLLTREVVELFCSRNTGDETKRMATNTVVPFGTDACKDSLQTSLILRRLTIEYG